MDIINEIVEYYLMSSIPRFKKAIYSPKSHKRVVLEQGDKKRIIFIPSKTMKMAQRYVLDKYLSKLHYSEHAYAYTKEKSIVDMAEVHKKNAHFLHIDIRHFFDNMDWGCFIKNISNNYKQSVFSEMLNNQNGSRDIKQILTFRNKFRQGSVTSPYISNLYLFEFDKAISLFVEEKVANGKYSRYSDDIIISSSEKIASNIIHFIREELKKYHLHLNYKKLHFFDIKNRVRITGLSLTKDGKITLNTKYKKNLKQMIYKTLNDDNYKVNFNELFGRIYYLIMCDPEYFNYLQVKYKNKKTHALMMDELREAENKHNHKQQSKTSY